MWLGSVPGPRAGVMISFFVGQQCRCFTSLVDRLSTAVTRRVTAVTDTHMMPLTKQSITERRRPYPRRASMPETLAERLELQKRLRTQLVPSQVIVSKDKLYIDFVWPATALDAAKQRHEEEVNTATATAVPSASNGGALKSSTGAHTRHHSLGEHRTRLLAEFLRAYSPSTDVIGADALIYGRRGITISDVFPVGNYALRIVFSDGHSGGVYPYEYLFHLGTHKYAMMREYIRRLRDKRKSREPPRRAPSQRLHGRRSG